jgi:hypothetical protein
MTTITPVELLRERRSKLITYFSLALGFSFPVLSVLDFVLQQEEEISLPEGWTKNPKYLTIKGRWILEDVPRPPKTPRKWLFIFSKPIECLLYLLWRTDIYMASPEEPFGGKRVGLWSDVERKDMDILPNEFWGIASYVRFYSFLELYQQNWG